MTQTALILVLVIAGFGFLATVLLFLGALLSLARNADDDSERYMREVRERKRAERRAARDLRVHPRTGNVHSSISGEYKNRGSTARTVCPMTKEW